MNGIINFFKPRGMTSHDAVYFFRKLLNIKRVGHTGTLDPNATGVLPICIGKATRISEYLVDADKEYIGELSLGYETDTQDGDGKVLRNSTLLVEKDDILESFSKFKGDISQVPPMYSALKYKGKKLYELARENIIIERKPRDIKIYELDIMNIQDNRKIIFYTKCSRGTYIRTLCHDIGMDLGTYGYMSYLIRTGVGDFKIDESLSMDYLKSLTIEEIRSRILPIDAALGKLEKIIMPNYQFNRIINGVIVEVKNETGYNIDKNLRVYCQEQFVGIGKIIEKEGSKYLKMDKVFI